MLLAHPRVVFSEPLITQITQLLQALHHGIHRPRPRLTLLRAQLHQAPQIALRPHPSRQRPHGIFEQSCLTHRLPFLRPRKRHVYPLSLELSETLVALISTSWQSLRFHLGPNMHPTLSSVTRGIVHETFEASVQPCRDYRSVVTVDRLAGLSRYLQD